MSQPELCFCGHSFWDHANSSDQSVTVHADYYSDAVCHGDLGACECTEFVWLGEEENDDDDET